MEELYLWGSAVVVGLLSLKLIPAKKLKAANNRMRRRFSGKAIALMYIIFWILIFVGALLICTAVNLNGIAKNIILGVILGAFIGLIPIVDKRNSGEEEDEASEEDSDKKK